MRRFSILGYLYFYSASNPFAFSQVSYLASYFRSVTGSSFAVMATVQRCGIYKLLILSFSIKKKGSLLRKSFFLTPAAIQSPSEPLCPINKFPRVKNGEMISQMAAAVINVQMMMEPMLRAPAKIAETRLKLKIPKRPQFTAPSKTNI